MPQYLICEWLYINSIYIYIYIDRKRVRWYHEIIILCYFFIIKRIKNLLNKKAIIHGLIYMCMYMKKKTQCEFWAPEALKTRGVSRGHRRHHSETPTHSIERLTSLKLKILQFYQLGWVLIQSKSFQLFCYHHWPSNIIFPFLSYIIYIIAGLVISETLVFWVVNKPSFLQFVDCMLPESAAFCVALCESFHRFLQHVPYFLLWSNYTLFVLNYWLLPRDTYPRRPRKTIPRSLIEKKREDTLQTHDRELFFSFFFIESSRERTCSAFRRVGVIWGTHTIHANVRRFSAYQLTL